MKHGLRRFGLAVGCALLAGGWGLTRYAPELPGQMPTEISWAGTSYALSTADMVVWGVLVMAGGAALFGFSLPVPIAADRHVGAREGFSGRLPQHAGRRKGREDKGRLFALATLLVFVALAAVMYVF